MRLTLSLLLCLFVPVCMMAQAPVADFTATPTTGCAPLSVQFVDKSTGNPTAWNWDFGPMGLSNRQNPTIGFPAGTYSVTLTVRNANGINSVTKSNFIVASPSPSVSFSANKTLACLPASINFTDLSVANAGTLNKWEWRFGDGTTSSSPNPTHPYANPGFYDVYLEVSNSAGCTSAASIGRYIRMVNGVKADFNFTGPTTCKQPFTVDYKNLTSGPGTLTYAWDLGNSSASSQTAPSVTYATSGTYTVKLRAQSEFGCADSIQKNIPINGIATTFSNGGKDSICLGSPIGFASTSTPAPTKVLWDFGDGTTSGQLTPPAKTYAAAGTYPVKLVATFTGCKDSLTKNIYVYGKPAVDFYADNANNCKVPHTVVFQNLAPDHVSSQWNFGDGSTSTANTPTVSHTYTTTGKFVVTLTITDSKGCTNVVSREYVRIVTPTAAIGSLPTAVCVGQVFNPVSTSDVYDGIASYSWDFGDGSPLNTSATPAHSYATAGSKTVRLTIVTGGGCSATTTRTVTVGPRPNIDFSADKLLPCRSDSVRFTNLTTPAGYTDVFWDFGDGSTSSSSANPVSHKFLDSGFFNIKLKVTSGACTDSLTKMNFVHVLPPVANFGYSIPDCNTKTAVQFTDSSLNNAGAYGPLVYQWSFGDAVPTTSVAANPSFSYPAIATYNVRLIVNNNLCSDTIIKPVRLYNTPAAFTMAKTAYCRNEQITFSTLNDYSFIKTFTWVIDGVPFVTDQGGHYATFGTTGSHTAQLITTDINGCVDASPVQTFTVTGPTASFSIANKGGCRNSTITFNDASVSSGTITRWVFDFGDGSPAQTFTAPPFTHNYANPGSYDVKLIVFDNTSGSCSDTFSLKGPAGAIITKPVALFGAERTTFCPNTPLNFTDSSTGEGLSHTWFFGDGGTAIGQNPAYSYAGRDSVYSVKLIVTDSVGCSDSLTRNAYIKIRSPKPLFDPVKDTATLCPPLESKFNFKGQDYESFVWDFGDGSAQSTLASTSHFYNSYGDFTAKLYVTGFGGCVDSASINIKVINPFLATTITFDPKTACNELTVNFNVIPPSSTRFHLYFGDGAIDSSGQTTIQHLYNFPSVYSPFVLLKDSTGCQVIYGGIGNVDIKGAVPLFGMDKNKFCDSGRVFFTDYSQDGNDRIVTRTLDFGDGTSTVFSGDADHVYTQPGLYVAKLTVTTQYPCTQTFTDTVRVLATPKPVITSQDGICTNLIVNFTGSLVSGGPADSTKWKWDLSGGQTSDSQNVSVNYPDTGLHRITLQATNSLGCKGDTAKTIRIFPLPAIALSGDTSIIAGAGGMTIPLTYSANATTFNWTPPDNLSCTDCGNPFATPQFTTTYRVRVTDANGCVSSRNVTLVVLCNNKNFFIPNTFSPNNDGSNDRFYPRGTGLDRIQALRIFNRWGEMVFEKRNFPANDATSGWDGMFRGKIAGTDTYIYMIDIICENATIITYKGNITLIR